jgi:hypothetical protein
MLRAILLILAFGVVIPLADCPSQDRNPAVVAD